MQTPRIVAIGTAVPARRFTQEELADLFGYSDGLRRSFFLNSGIDARHLYITAADPRRETIDEMSARFAEGSVRLGVEAVEACLARAGLGVADVDFLVTTTCTGTARPEPRRAPDRSARSPERRAARPRGGHRLRERDGRAPAGVELPPRLPGAPGARRVGRALLDHLLPGRRGRDRGGERDLRGRRRRRAAHHDGRRARDPRPPDADPSGVPGSHGVHLPGRSLPHPPVARGAADRAGDDGGAGRSPPQGPRARAGGRAVLGAPLRRPAGDRERPGPARPVRRRRRRTRATFSAATATCPRPPCSSSWTRSCGAAGRGRATSAS